MNFKALVTAGGFLLGLGVLGSGAQAAETPTGEAVVAHYADLALAKYDDSLITARTMKTAIEDLLSAPSEATLEKARAAWRAARRPYQQSEV